MSLILFYLFSGLVALLTIIYFFIRKKYSYWADRNVNFIKPEFPFGNIKDLGSKYQTSQLLHQFYKQLKDKGPIGGIYFLLSPVAVVTDLNLIKNILIKDFQHFQERGVYHNEKDDPLSANLFNLESVKWKHLRHKLTPTFTSGKMKFMFPTMVEVAEHFQFTLNRLLAQDEVLEVKDLLARFTTDIIGTCAFGINCNSLDDPKAEFRTMGKKVFETSRHPRVVHILMASFRSTARWLGMKSVQEDVSKFFMKVVRETVEYRETNNIKRNDFMDLLIQLKKNGQLDDNTDDKHNVGAISIEEIAAQSFVFFLAGFETSSTALSFTLYELAINPNIQQKARDEIVQVLKNYNGELTYEAMMDMTYINCIINGIFYIINNYNIYKMNLILESLRKYPPGAHIIRQVTKDYLIADTKVTLEKGTMLMIPSYSIHHDAYYYPDPEKFNPDRFLPSEVQERHPMTYIPFGDGPRNCIGLRFGLLQVRIGIIMLLKKFEFCTCEKTVIPVKFSSRGLVLTNDGGLYLNVKVIK